MLDAVFPTWVASLPRPTGRFVPRVVLLGLGWCLVAHGQEGAAVSAPSDASTPQHSAQTFFETHCFDCHGDGAAEGGLALDECWEQWARQPETPDRQRWSRVWHNLRAGLMPPHDVPRPPDTGVQATLHWIETAVFQLDAENVDPGPAFPRRLNRSEYRYVIRDLLGIRFPVEEFFPPDDTGYGFDTVGAALTVSPMLIEKYLEAAATIAREAAHAKLDGSDWNSRVYLKGPPPEEAGARHDYLEEVLSRMATRAFRHPMDPASLASILDLAALPDAPDDQAFREAVARGLTAMLSSPRFLFLHTPSAASVTPEKRGALVDERALAHRLSFFLWRSLPDEELLQLAEAGTLRQHWGEQIDRLIAHSKFIRFIENFVGQWLRVQDIPGTFVNARFVLRGRSDFDERQFTRQLKKDMQRETERFVLHLIREDRPVLELLNADYSFVNERLAKFYQLPDVEGNEWRRVSLDGTPRRGILGHAGILVATSNPTRTSPVKRGLFVLENVLGTPPPPAPPDVPPLESGRSGDAGQRTMRQRMEAHRADPACAACHARMDPIGLALEKFDALGLYREEERGLPIDTQGTLVTGETFASAHELATVLAQEKADDFFRCLAEKLLIFSLGRGLEYYDLPTIDKIAVRLQADGASFRTAILAVAESVPFQQVRTPTAATQPFVPRSEP